MKEEIKLSLSTDDMIVYVENLKMDQKTPGISNYNKVTRYKVSI